MKKILYIYIVLYSSFCFSQNIFLTEAKEIHANNDKFLYALKEEPKTDAQYLGKIEVSGFSNDDAAVFSEIYKKAKSIGGNTYFMKPAENIEGNSTFNPHHYILYIYYKEKQTIPQKENTVYLINPEKEIEVRINNKKINLPQRSFLQLDLSQQEITDISVGKFLGSRIKLQAKNNQPEQYFQISGKRISVNSPASAGINYKTGDIIALEKSFAEFLLTIYEKI